MRLVILQPFYLPYCGVFEQVRLADVFVYYDDVQFVRRNWQHRNQIKTADGPKWLSVPVAGSSRQPLIEARVNNEQDWRSQHLGTLQHAYGKAPHGAWLLEALTPIYEREWDLLVDLDIASFEILCGLLGVGAEMQRSSELGLGGTSHERIMNHCVALGADEYLSGPSASDYLDEAEFSERGIALEYLGFDHPTYPQQHGDFVPYLSVVDLLANVGPAAGALLAGCGRAVPAAEMELPA